MAAKGNHYQKGTNIMIKCPKCGAEAEEGASFCPTCGAPIAPASVTEPEAKIETAPRAGTTSTDSKIAGALACGIVGIVASIVGIFFAGMICGAIAIGTGISGLIASKKAMKEGKRGPLAVSALVVSIVSIGFGAIVFVLTIVSTILVALASAAA